MSQFDEYHPEISVGYTLIVVNTVLSGILKSPLCGRKIAQNQLCFPHLVGKGKNMQKMNALPGFPALLVIMISRAKPVPLTSNGYSLYDSNYRRCSFMG